MSDRDPLNAGYLSADRDDAAPAFPQANLECPPSGWGWSRREHAAIQLRVPDSGQPWLDDMIRQARRMDAAQEAMRDGIAALAASGWENLNDYQLRRCANGARMAADALLAALKEG